jgi:hypothetical protein
MKTKTTSVAILGAFALSGCVSVPAIKPPPPTRLQISQVFVSSTLPSAAEKYSATDIPGTYFGASGASGSLAVGLLFGVIGAAANAAYVAKENRAHGDSLPKLTSINLADFLSAEFPAHPSNGGYELTPSANIYFETDTTYVLSCTVTAKAVAKDWNARYTVAMNGVFDSKNDQDTVEAIRKLEPCVQDAAKLFVEQAEGKLGPFEKRTVTAPRADGKGDVAAVYNVDVSALPSHIIVSDRMGVVQFRDDPNVRIER